MKKLISLLICVALLLSTFCMQITSVVAIGQATITISDKTCKQGESISLSVSLENNPGIMFLSVTPTCYDSESNKTDYLTVSVENGDLFSITNGKNPVFDSDSDVTDDGVLCTLNITVSENTPAGTYTVTLISRGCYNSSENNVEVNIVAGTVTVEAIPVSATGVSLNKETISLNTGASETLIATVFPDNVTNKTVAWESSDTTVATVDNNGKVTAVKKGTATITVTTEDGSFTDNCVVSVACSHVNTTVHPANTSTCLVQGNNEYTTCDDCGIVVSGSEAKLPLAEHKGGTATCKDKAVCTVCNQPYGDYASHKLTNHPRNEADHDNTGNIEYWTCDVCNKYFSDSNGTAVIAQTDTIIEKVPHSHSTTWSKNDNQHWHECGCGNKIDIANHNFDNDCDTMCDICGYIRTTTHDWNTTWSTDNNGHWIECKECGEKKDEGTHNGGTATCIDKAICATCNKAYGSLVAHSYKDVVDVKYLKSAANCISAAVYYKSCEVCEIASTTETFANGAVDATNHIGGTYLENQKEADCVNKGYTGDRMCNSCRTLVEPGNEIEVGAHNPASVWSTDAENHWKDCQTVGCGNLIDKAPHSGGTATCKNKAICSVCNVEYGTTNTTNHAGETEIKNAVEATCTTDGYSGDTYCKDCGVKIADGKTVEAGHKTVKVAEVPATHEKDGNIEYYTCSGCDKLFSDEKATTEITLADTVIAKGEHSYGDTYENDADNHWKACGCGNVIEKAVHTFEEWSVTKEATETEKGSREKVCSVCGYKVVEEIPVVKGDDTTNPDDSTDSGNSTNKDNVSENSPQTGDTSNMFLWIALLILSGTGLVITTSIKRKRAK